MRLLGYFSYTDDSNMLGYSRRKSRSFSRYRGNTIFMRSSNTRHFIGLNNAYSRYGTINQKSQLRLKSIPKSSINMYTESQDCFIEEYIEAGFYE